MAASGASRAWKESGDVECAENKVGRLQEDLAEMKAVAGREIAELKEKLDPMNENFEEIHLTPLKKYCSSKSVGIAWFPQHL